MVENAITKVARIASHAAQGLVYKDSAGKEQTILPTGDKNMIDISGLSISNGSGGDTGGGDNPDHPSAGVDYYAGSLTDGEITERYLLYQRDKSVTEDPTKSKTVTLLRDVGTKFNMAGDGATFLIHIQKTAMTKGAKGAVTDIELNYDHNNIAKGGYFTTTSPYPIYIKASDLATKKTLAIPINGIGESLSGKNVKAPQLNVTFNGNGTMTFESVTGYDNDGDSSGATGANYDVVVDTIATFSTQTAVAQLPSSINLFTGSATGNVVLSGISKFYENSMDGLEITLDDYIYDDRVYLRYSISDLGIKKTFRIPKEQLIVGNKAPVKFDYVPMADPNNKKNVSPLKPGERLKELVRYEKGSNGQWLGSTNPSSYPVGENINSFVEVNGESINVGISREVGSYFASWTYSQYYAQVLKVVPYKE